MSSSNRLTHRSCEAGDGVVVVLTLAGLSIPSEAYGQAHATVGTAGTAAAPLPDVPADEANV
jgi:hypothetical protein